MYKNGVVIFPNNAEIVDGKYILKPKDPSLPDDQVSSKVTSCDIMLLILVNLDSSGFTFQKYIQHEPSFPGL